VRHERGSILHELEDRLSEVMGGLETAAPEVKVDTLAGIISTKDSRGYRLLLVPRFSGTFTQEYKNELPAKPVEQMEMDAGEVLRSFFSKGDAWRSASDRCIQAAMLAVARQVYPKASETRFAVRLGEVVATAILARRGVRSIRYGLPGVRSDDLEAYGSENAAALESAPSLIAESDPFGLEEMFKSDSVGVLT